MLTVFIKGEIDISKADKRKLKQFKDWTEKKTEELGHLCDRKIKKFHCEITTHSSAI